MLKIKNYKEDKHFKQDLEFIVEEIYINYATVKLLTHSKEKNVIDILEKALKIC